MHVGVLKLEGGALKLEGGALKLEGGALKVEGGPVEHCQNLLKSMSFHDAEIMQNLDSNATSWINALKGLIKVMESWCLEHINEGLSWKDDGRDAKEIFASCPLGSEAVSVTAEALEILETMEQRGVFPDAWAESKGICNFMFRHRSDFSIF